jgi:hypothetical protein
MGQYRKKLKNPAQEGIFGIRPSRIRRKAVESDKLAISSFVIWISSFSPIPQISLMLSHNVFFNLKDRSEKAKAELIEGCKKYLTGHAGTVFFCVGPLADDIAWEVSDRNFDVALQIVFDTKAAHNAYQDSPQHEEFFEKLGGNWENLRSFDAYVEKT